MKKVSVIFVMAFGVVLGGAVDQNEYQKAAQELDRIVAENYAYMDKLPGAELPQSEVLTSEREAVNDSTSLFIYSEKRIASLVDHHAITGSSFSDSWALVPTYADLWIVRQNGRYLVDAVRMESSAEQAGIRRDDQVTMIDGLNIDEAVANFWNDLGLDVTESRAECAARVLVAGRRDRPRKLGVKSSFGDVSELVLPSLYELEEAPKPVITTCSGFGHVVVRFNNSLGDRTTIEEFDEFMRAVPSGIDLYLDLRNTPSGGNTTVARAIMGWFVTEAHGYQIHNRPAEERATGIGRQWIEQVLPRTGLYHSNLPTVLVGRWTGSMGEGLAVGFASMGAEITGTRMAGLNGSIEEFKLGDTGYSVRIPTERLIATNGVPREDFVPATSIQNSPNLGLCQT